MKKIELKEMQTIEKDILHYIDEICIKNNITYAVVGGTAIGTIRHNGFIPWDDDIDIGLDRENYYKLIEILKNENNNKYKLLDWKIENSYNYPYAKVIDTRTAMIEKNQFKIKEYGVFVDIFKYDGMPKNKLMRNIYFCKLKFYYRCLNCLISDKTKDNNIIKKIINKYANMIGREKMLKKYTAYTNKYNMHNSDFCTSNWPMVPKKHQILKSNMLDSTIRHQFEDIEINIMKNYDEYLTIAYGDYMKLPPVEKRVNPHPSVAEWRNQDNE